MTPNRIVAALGALIYLVVGVAGIVASVGLDPLQTPGVVVLGSIQINLARALVDVAVAIVLGAAAVRGDGAARRANLVLGVVFLLLGVVGLIIGDGPANVLALDGVADLAHLLTAAVLLVTAFVARSRG